jgi:hypothetical protein
MAFTPGAAFAALLRFHQNIDIFDFVDYWNFIDGAGDANKI